MNNDALGPVVRLAPAKLNLTLAVLGRRRDGFHDLHSVMVPLGLADRLSLAPTAVPAVVPGGASGGWSALVSRATGAAAAAPRDSLHVIGGEDGNQRMDPSGFHSVLAGIEAARRIVGRGADAVPLAARLEKRIPVAAGLAGGSSDAAAAIDGAMEAWGAEVGPEGRLAAAAAVGSDVPFFLARGIAIVEGRGERVTPLPGFHGPAPGVLLVTPRVEVSTAAAFARLDQDPAAAPANRGSTLLSSQHLAAELAPGAPPLRALDLVRRAGALAVANDLDRAADLLVPGLRALRRALMRLLGVPIGLSGSGPTLWALYPSLVDADAAAERTRAEMRLGTLDSPGTGLPFVVATTIEGGRGRTAT